MARRASCILTTVGTLLAAGLLAPGAGEASTAERVVVLLRSGVEPAAVAGDHGASVTHLYRSGLRGFAASVSSARMAALRADARVAGVVPDTTFSAAGKPARSTQVLPTGVRRIGGDVSSTQSGNGRGSVPVNVAVLDEGILLSQPELNVVGGFNCSTGDGYGPSGGHGTLVAGSIAAVDNSTGVVGVAPGARLWSVRVLKKNGSGTLGDILCGVDWVTSTRTDADPSNDIAVANMSLTGPGSDDGRCGAVDKDALHRSICAATAAGVTVVAAAGNEAVDLAGVIPAGYDEVLAVTALNDTDGLPGGVGGVDACGYGLGPDDTAASFSNFGVGGGDASHVVAAPGVCSATTSIVGYTEYWLGTSLASPYAAGVVGLCLASGACAGLTPAQIISKVVSDAAAYTAGHPGYGFEGDLVHPVSGRQYGPLVCACLY